MATPGISPYGLNAYGMARIPAPHAVCNKVKIPERIDEDIWKSLGNKYLSHRLEQTANVEE